MYIDLHTLVSYPLLHFKKCLEAFFFFLFLGTTTNSEQVACPFDSANWLLF